MSNPDIIPPALGGVTPVASDAPPAPDPRIGDLLDTAQRLQENAATLKPPNYPGMSVGQALVGVAGALATADNPHARFVAGFMPALGQAVEQQYGSQKQGWQVARENLLDQANLLRQRASGLQQWQEDMYKAQMGVYGQQVRGVGAAEVRASSAAPPASPPAASATSGGVAGQSAPSDPNAARLQMLRQRGIPDDASARYLPGVSRLPDTDAATWAGNQATSDQLIGLAGRVASPPGGAPFDLGSALFTISSIRAAAQSMQNQVPALRAARISLAAQRAAVDPASDAARNLQAGIDQYDRAIQANGAQLDRLAGASRQVSDAIAARAARTVAPPALPSPQLNGAIGY